ncbi:MAG: bifunctional folylpolyglutamate synthase/dihydrofolate synthase [Bacteroidales bacterium]|nr:bifunctional folylpolyglutamate synthase/dihydrofolate synthase [Bacteroidales bacterium]
MTYQDAIDFLFSSLPMYQRQGKAAYKANLDNSLRMDAYFGNPHHSFPTIHVAGTNGKGSVSHMLASVFQQSGYKTGLYTSPHLLDFRERIRINGQPIPEQNVTEFVTDHQPIIVEVSPSFFEMTVAMAFDYFALQKVDVAIIETGLGGRLDSTNIITPQLSIITNISLDHTEFLGNDLASIAREKGGIIKQGIPLIIGHADRDTEQLFLSMAGEKQSPVTLAYHSFEPAFQTFNQEGNSLMRIRNLGTGSMETLTCDLTGSYQQENVITALTAIGLLQKLGWNLPRNAMESGLVSVVKNTGIMGRWQTVGHHPRSICDTAHNQAGIEAVMKQVMSIPWKELHVVWGMVNDKDIGSILPLLPKKATYYFTRSSVPRSLDANQLHMEALACGLKGEAYPTVEEAYRAAQQKSGTSDMIFTGGSTFVVADLLKASGHQVP